MVWFDDCQNALVLNDNDWKAIASSVLTALQQRHFDLQLPAALRADVEPRIVFLSVSDRETPAIIVRGTELGLEKAIKTGLEKLIRDFEPQYSPQWLKIDLVQEVIASTRLNSDRPLGFERSLQGIAFDRESAIAFLPEELVTYSLMNDKQCFIKANIGKYLEKSPSQYEAYQKLAQAKSYKLYRFICTSFFSDGVETVPLYRGHRLFNDFSKETLLESAIAGGEYLQRCVAENGRFLYCYRPKTDTVMPQYNILRHAGTIYAMLELYAVTEDKNLLEAAKRAIAYLLEQIQPATAIAGIGSCVIESGEVKLGGNALAAIALMKYAEVTGDRQYLPTAIELGRWIQSIQGESGEFLVHKQAQNQDPDEFRSNYYPGEAILALVRLHAQTEETHWLDTAEAAAKHRIQKYDRKKVVPQDHWLLYALNELNCYRPVPVYVTYAGRIADAIVQRQHIQPLYPDWLGSFDQPPHSTPTATRTEGLSAAYRLAQVSGNTSQLGLLLETIVLGVSFQLQTQIRPELAMYCPNPSRSLGGFRRSLTNYEIRIDYVQHNLSSLLALYEISCEHRTAWEQQKNNAI
jgi:hypothetical protein